MIKKFSDFYIGQIAIFKKVFVEDDFKKFLELSGDENSLHWDKGYAKKTTFKRPIVPLQLSTAPLSRVAGMIFPGEPSLFLTNNVKAIKPIFYKDEIIYSAKIISISLSTKILGIRVLAIRSEEIVIDAFIKVKVLKEEWEQRKKDETKYLSIKDEDQSYLITGASGEIGSAIAIKLAKKGYKLILVYRNEDKNICKLKDNLDKLNGSYQSIKLDLCSKDFKENFYKQIKKINLSNGISGIIHTASPAIEDRLENLVQVNYSAFKDIIKSLLPKMLIRQKSIILFISSIAVLKHIDGWEDYIAAKIMTTSFLSGLNFKFSNYGLNFTTLMPGFIKTKYSEKFRNDNIALLPEEIAEEISNLCNKDSIEIMKLVPNKREIGFYSDYFKFNSDNINNSIAENIPIKVLDDLDNNDDIIKKLNNEFKNILNIDESLCREGLSIENNPEWDSLNHFQLIASIENIFSIKFDSVEINTLTDYSSLLQTILAKCRNN